MLTRLILLASLFLVSCNTAEVGPDGGPASDALAFADLRPDTRIRRDSARDEDSGPRFDLSGLDGEVSDGPRDGGSGNDAGCSNSPCSLVPQCGCKATEACDLDLTDLANGSTRCRPVTVEGYEFAECTGTTTCAAGFVCIDRGGTKRCNQWCTDPNQCNGGACVSVIYGEPVGEVPGAFTCALDCDPVSNLGCPQDWACRIYSRPNDGLLFTDCTLPGGGAAGSTCTLDTDCVLGTYCSPVSSKCLELCRLTPPESTCSAGTCASFAAPVVVGNVEYGFCQQ